MDKSRQQFEEWRSKNKSSTINLFDVWQASRESLEVELPKYPDESDPFYDDMDIGISLGIDKVKKSFDCQRSENKMITGEYIVDCVIYNKDNNKEVGKANALLSDVSVNSATDFYKLVLEVVGKNYDYEVLVRIVGVFKL